MSDSLDLYAQTCNVCFLFNSETIHKGWYDEYTLVKVHDFVCIFIDSSPVSHDISPLDWRRRITQRAKRLRQGKAKAKKDADMSLFSIPAYPVIEKVSRELSPSSLTTFSEIDAASKQSAHIQVNKLDSAKCKRYDRMNPPRTSWDSSPKCSL